MITIVRGNEKIVCSYRTYDEQFKQHGYVIASEIKKVSAKVKEEPILKEETKEETKEEVKEIANEEEKIGSKYGVRRRTSAKKEE